MYILLNTHPRCCHLRIQILEVGIHRLDYDARKHESRVLLNSGYLQWMGIRIPTRSLRSHHKKIYRLLGI